MHSNGLTDQKAGLGTDMDIQTKGHSKKWPKEGVLRPKIAKGRGFEGVEALQIRARTLFCQSFGKNELKIWVNGVGGGSDPHIPPLATPLCNRRMDGRTDR